MFTGDTRSNQDIIEYLHQVFVVGGASACYRGMGGGCRYAPQDSMQVGCAVGCLLPRETTEEWDTLGPASILDIYELYSEGFHDFFDEDQLMFLSDIQMFHDRVVVDTHDRADRYNDLSRIAEKHNLNLCKENN